MDNQMIELMNEGTIHDRKIAITDCYNAAQS